MDDVEVIVDKRERAEELIKRLGELCRIKMELLDIGDYLISDDLCIERKSIKDFESSIFNGRLFEQLRLLGNNYKKGILLLEGNPSEFSIYKGSIEGAIVSVYIKYGLQVIVSRSQAESAKLIYIMARQSANKNNGLSPKRGRRAYSEDMFMEYIVGNIPGIGNKLAKLLLERFGSIDGIAHASVEEMMGVEKIGKKKAEMIYRIMHRSYATDKRAQI